MEDILLGGRRGAIDLPSVREHLLPPPEARGPWQMSQPTEGGFTRGLKSGGGLWERGTYVPEVHSEIPRQFEF